MIIYSYLIKSFRLPSLKLKVIALILTLISTGCQQKSDKSNFTAQKSQASFLLKQESQTRQIKEDTTKLTDILKQNGLLQQMIQWEGKALFVKVEDFKTPPEFHYYYHNAVYIDTNNNHIQDSSDRGFFNPASTVKVGIAALVLEKLNQQNLGRETEYRILGNNRWYRIEQDIKRSLVISDNESTNRLILWLGFEQLNRRMQAKGLDHFVVDRLMLDKGTLVTSPPFQLRFNNQVIQQPKQPVTTKFGCWETGQKLGNCASASDLIEVLTRIVQPNYFNANQSFNIREADRIWLQQVMSHTPKQEGFNYPDNYCRVLTTVQSQLANKSGRMLSKCGVAVFSPTYIDTSFIETDTGQKYYIVFAVTPGKSVPESKIKKWMNTTVSLVLSRLP